MWFVGLTLEEGNRVSSVQVVDSDEDLFDLPAAAPRIEGSRTITRLFDEFRGPFETEAQAEAEKALVRVRSISDAHPCPRCEGRGYVAHPLGGHECPDCGGEGIGPVGGECYS
jgi:hypothetical protein